jgi:hypothetical protein
MTYSLNSRWVLNDFEPREWPGTELYGPYEDEETAKIAAQLMGDEYVQVSYHFLLSHAREHFAEMIFHELQK